MGCLLRLGIGVGIALVIIGPLSYVFILGDGGVSPPSMEVTLAARQRTYVMVTCGFVLAFASGIWLVIHDRRSRRDQETES